MQHELTGAFLRICKQIVDESKSLEEWAEIESDDMFQNEDYVGGFDATEMEFCFSVFIDNNEYWFQISLEKVNDILNRTVTHVEVRQAE